MQSKYACSRPTFFDGVIIGYIAELHYEFSLELSLYNFEKILVPEGSISSIDIHKRPQSTSSFHCVKMMFGKTCRGSETHFQNTVPEVYIANSFYYDSVRIALTMINSSSEKVNSPGALSADQNTRRPLVDLHFPQDHQ